MIEINHLVKKYGNHIAVDDLNLTIEPGKIYGFLGPNGAGKSTTMNILTGYLAATSGEVKINGFDILAQPEEAKKCIGYLPELPPVYMEMTVQEYMNFAAELKKIDKSVRKKNVEEVMALADYSGGLDIVISAPGGEEIAKKTFNPRLGIVGGISILGTTGIVEPMSEAALVETIRVELRQRRAMGKEYALLTPGNYGSDFIRQNLDVDLNTAVQVSNFLGDALDICRALGFRGALLVGHVGKLVKTAGGMMNTHSKYGDCRMEILAAHAAAAGVDAEHIREILDCAACDDAVRILRECGRDAPALARVTERALFHLSHRADGMEIGLLMFSKEYGVLGQSENAPALLKKIMEE